jgi:hypothetical protein
MEDTNQYTSGASTALVTQAASLHRSLWLEDYLYLMKSDPPGKLTNELPLHLRNHQFRFPSMQQHLKPGMPIHLVQDLPTLITHVRSRG